MLAAVLFSAVIAASPAPSPSPTPSAPSDPCGSILSIVTRPTVTTSTCPVRYGHALLETGYSNTVTTGPGGGVTASYPQAFARIGIGHGLEFSFTPPSYERTSVGNAFASGWSDVNFGAKWEMGYTAKAVWGVNAAVSTPSGSPGFTAGAPEYTGNFNWGYTLNSIFSASGTLGFNWLAGPNAAEQTQRHSAFIPTLEITGALPGTAQAFAEYAYFSSAGPGLGSKSIIDFGYQRDFNPHLQVDIEYGFQPTPVNGQRTHYVGAGLSFMT
jgi:hypothetical protein